jgi:septum formation protein
VLASRSPQRRALLTQLRLPFRVAEPDYDEPDLPVAPAELVRTHALAKARSVTPEAGDGPVLGVDTAVVLADATVLGKPADAPAARAMLARLEGREHRVLSGLALIAGGRELVGHAETVVRFRPLTADEIDAYVATGEWQGRAGAYAIQGLGAGLVTDVAGCYPNVVGLPVALLVATLGEVGYPLLAGKQARAG